MKMNDVVGLKKEPKVEKSFSEVMLDAADRIEKRGLMYYNFYGSDGRLCTFAAIMEANGGALQDETIDNPNHARLEAWLKEKRLSSSICGFNNSHKKEEVVAMLRRAAVEA